MVVDGSAQDGTTRTWATANGITPSAGNGLEINYAYVAGAYTTYSAFYSDSGTIASRTIGLTVPATQTYRFIAIELVGEECAIGFNNGIGSYTATSQLTTNVSIPMGTNRLTIVSAAVGVQPANGTDSSVTTTATLGGRAMTSIAKVHSNNGTQGYVELFYLWDVQPGTGVPCKITASTSADLHIDATTFMNVNRSNPFSVQTAYGSSTTASVTFSNLSWRCGVFQAVASANNISGSGPNGSPSGTSSYTSFQNFNNLSSAGCSMNQLIARVATSQTACITVTSGAWATIALALNPSSYFPPGAVSGFTA